MESTDRLQALAPFYYSDRIPRYSFGERHPLKPERLRRTVELLSRYGIEPTDPGPGHDEDPLRVHAAEYVEAVRRIGEEEAERPSVEHDGRFGYRSNLPDEARAFRARYGFGSLDNPPFAEMHAISLDYVRASAAAAEAVRDGERLAFCVGGGLHHAMRARASGFCIYNDLSVAVTILRERFPRVAYVDIDVHHGDGVQALFLDDPAVLTVSIHEDGRTLFPGTGAIEETGAAFTAVNVPVPAKTSGDVWLGAFRRAALPAIERFRPDALVLQLGTDAHWLDPLGHVRCTQGDWLSAVRDLAAFGLPMVVGGGGGYNLLTVPRMWSSAVLTLAGIEYEDALPADLARAWETPTFADPAPPDRGQNRDVVERVIERVRAEVLPHVPA